MYWCCQQFLHRFLLFENMNRVTIISGTNRPGNNSQHISRFCLEYLKSEGVEVNIFSLEDLPEDFAFNEQYGRRSEKFDKVIKTFIEPVDKFVFVVPEYNGGFPGVLKTFIDCVPPPNWQNKMAALIGLSSGHAGNSRGLDHLTGVLHYLKMEVMALKPKLSNIESLLDENKNLIDERGQKSVKEQMEKLMLF